MNDFWPGKAEAKGRAGCWDRMTPMVAILCAVGLCAICGDCVGDFTTVNKSVVPLVDVVVKSRDDEGAGGFILWVEREAAGDGVAPMAVGNILGKVEIKVKKSSAVTLLDGFGDVGIADEPPVMIGASSDDESIPDGILTEDLLYQGVVHVAEEAH